MSLWTALLYLWQLGFSIKSTPSGILSIILRYPFGILGKLWCLAVLNQRKLDSYFPQLRRPSKGIASGFFAGNPLKQSSMEKRYGLTRQGSGVWRALTDGDFEEEDVWEVLKDRNSSSNKKFGRAKEYSVSVPRQLPTASRMIPKASSHNYGSGSSCSSSNTITHDAKIVQQSAPVNIPDWSKVYGQKSKKAPKNVSWQIECDDGDDGDDEEVGDDGGDSDDDEEEDYDSKVPPHEFIARRLARSQISFSVFEGAGRTLKGRDLSKVRNAVLTKTGFLESL